MKLAFKPHVSHVLIVSISILFVSPVFTTQSCVANGVSEKLEALKKGKDMKSLTRYDSETEKDVKKWFKINKNITILLFQNFINFCCYCCFSCA